MVNFNGKIIAENSVPLGIQNRAFKYGDALFETLKVEDGKVNFIEDHYFRLMASMRMLRMSISMEFTLEFFENEILKTVKVNNLNLARVRFSVNRKEGGLYAPITNTIDFLIEANELKTISRSTYEIDVFKDYYVYSGILSTLKTNNKILNVLAGIYAEENGLDNCILLNEKKQVVEALNANIFLIKGNQIITPSLSEGCLKGVMRKNIIKLIQKDTKYEIIETEISPFEMQKVDEVFISNAIVGIQAITKYRKKHYSTEASDYLKSILKIS
jgi:branched-chain amino acid aminotransferase